jgi:hypothetical protein
MMYQWVCGGSPSDQSVLGVLHSRISDRKGRQLLDRDATKVPSWARSSNRSKLATPDDPATVALYKQLYHIVALDKPYTPLFFLYQGFPWNNEYFTGITNQVEPWYWLYQFRGMLMFIDQANK